MMKQNIPMKWVGLGLATTATAVLAVPALRRPLISKLMLKVVRSLGFMPKISPTERAALRSGDVWVEGDLFSGNPHWPKLRTQPYPQLTSEEQAFIDGPVEELCKRVNDWDVWQTKDLPPEAWNYIKKERFLGMIIPPEYGGLGFSALAHSEVIMKLASRSVPLAITVMVPNSLGPAELLIHYGTQKQKDYYLPRLAQGIEIPCFALTEPEAGSDASSIQSEGIVFKGDDGKLYLRLNWNKRWITLAAISTVLGLAFRLKDPENHLGKGEDVGITCALIPTQTPGVQVNRRHDPLGVPFYNSPTQGHDVIVPIENIIGGADRAGQGWTMLMQSLAAGRGISLPAESTGGAKSIARIVSAHSAVRKQFGMSIGQFEGIAEPLARIGGYTYIMEAARRYTCGALDQGIRPSIVTAIAKYQFTELARKIVNDGMDVQGGIGISRGPRNLLANAYIATPISITVEGANILTRTLMIFGQGALRAHPYALKVFESVENNDLRAFDHTVWSHLGHFAKNIGRVIGFELSRGYFAFGAPKNSLYRYYQKLNWASAAFAVLADTAMFSLGSRLKSQEKLTGRFADALSWMYLGTAVLRRYEAEGFRKEDRPLLRWSMDHTLYQIQNALSGILMNFSAPVIGPLFRGPLYWLSELNPLGTPPSDEDEIKIAALMQKPGEQRDRLFGGIYVPSDSSEPFARLEAALDAEVRSLPILRKIKRAVKERRITKKPSSLLYRDALDLNIITSTEFSQLRRADELRHEVIQVDDFSLDDYRRKAA